MSSSDLPHLRQDHLGRMRPACGLGQRGHTAARLLRQHRRAVRNLDGGFLTWTAGTRMKESA